MFVCVLSYKIDHIRGICYTQVHDATHTLTTCE